jgi:hypothetical protein
MTQPFASSPVAAAVEATGVAPLDQSTDADHRSAAYLAEKEAVAKATPWGELWDAGINNNHIFINVSNANRLLGKPLDEEYELEAERLQKDFEDRGLPLHWMEEFGDTVSEDQYVARLQMLEERAANDRKLMEAGGRGFLANLGTSFTDPVAFAAELVAAPLAAGAKANKLRKVAQAGAAGAATNAALGAAQAISDPDYDFSDFAFDATVGAVLGAGIDVGGSLLSKEGRAELAGSLWKAGAKVNPGGKFGDDTASAARVAGSDVEQFDVDVLETDFGANRSGAEVVEMNMHLADLKDTVGKTFRIDGMRYVQDQTPEGQVTLRLLHSSNVGVKDGQVNATGAVERSVRYRQIAEGDFGRGYKAAMKDYVAERVGFGKRWITKEASTTMNDSFAREVALHVRGAVESTNAAVIRAAAQVRKSLDGIYDVAARAGVRGMDAAKKVANYFPRVVRSDFKETVLKDINTLAAYNGRTAEETLGELMTEAVKQGIRKADAGKADEVKRVIDDELSAKVGKAYAMRLLGLKDGSMGQIDRMTELRLDYLEEVLEEAGLDPADVAAIRDKFTVEKMPDGKAGPSDRLKQRLDLDETVHLTMPDGRKLHVYDLFDNHAERVTNDYIREFSGHAALADTGFTSWREAQNLIETQFGTGKLDKNGKQMADIALKSILGRPLETDPLGWGGRFTRMLMDFNFLRSMGSVVFSMLSENGKIVGMVGLRATMRAVPEMGVILRQALKGELPDDLAREIAALSGVGSSMLRTSVGLRPDDLNMPGFTNGFIGKVDKMQQRLKRMQTFFSGLGPVTDIQQVAVSRLFLHRLGQEAAEGFSPVMRSRLKDYGLTPGDLTRLSKHLAENAERKNGVLTKTNFDQLPPGTQRRFGEAMSRMARHVIQEADVGAVPFFMHSKLGKLFMQFRTFSVAAYARHTLHGAAKHDSVWALGAMSAMGFAALGYIGNAYVNHGNNPERLKSMLEEGEIAKMALARSSDASILPMIADSVANAFGYDAPFTNTRNSGIGTNLINGSASYDTFSKAGDIVSMIGSIRKHGTPTREQVRSLTSMIYMNRIPGLLQAQTEIANLFPSQRDLPQDRD